MYSFLGSHDPPMEVKFSVEDSMFNPIGATCTLSCWAKNGKFDSR